MHAGFLGPTVGVGTWSWGNQFLWGYEPGHDGEIQACFERCISGGLHVFDTADSYGTGRFEGRSEMLLGRFCASLPASQQQQLTIATKLAPFPWRLGRRGFNRAFEASKQRLQGKLDLVQLHWSTYRYAPWQEIALLDGLGDLLKAGHVAGIGVSNFGPYRLRCIHSRLAQRGLKLTSLQVQLSLLSPMPVLPGGVAEVCRELDIALIAYSPLAFGLLTCPPGNAPPAHKGIRGWLAARLWAKIQPLLQIVEAIAYDHHSDAAQVALNWCRAHGASPIPGLRREAQANSAIAAMQWKLAESERAQLDYAAFSCEARMPVNPFQSS